LTATDACSNATVTYNQAITNVVCAGTYTITRTWTATDTCGNATNASQTINVIDITPPTFSQATPIDVAVSCDAVPTAPVLSASDSCGTATVVMTEVTTPSTICPSTYTLVRTWTATDLCGNPASVSQTINVSDSTGPFIVGNFDTTLNATCDAIPLKPELEFGDNCSTFGAPVYTEVTSPVVANVYTITRTWLVTDACGNSSTFIQVVTVTQTTDVITLPSVQTSNDINENLSLNALLPAGVTNGTWTNVNGVGGFDSVNGTFNPFGITPADYLFSYIINNGSCRVRYDVTFIVGQVDPCGNVVVHNAITPNNDALNLNEFFYIENIEQACHLPNSVEIFNRWGVLVYEVKNYDNNTKKFVGISEGRATVNKSAELPTGTYFYVIKYATSGGTTVAKDGYLYLTR
jgi:gliding motility-associated-like protein